MKVTVGKEAEFIGHRLNDIKFLAEQTEPVNGDWEAYAKSVLRVISRQAYEAKQMLALAGVTGRRQ